MTIAQAKQIMENASSYETKEELEQIKEALSILAGSFVIIPNQDEE